MSIEQRTLALAGIYQAAELVRQVARQGLVDQTPFEISIHSVLKLDASSTEEVYGGLDGVKMGLQMLCTHFSSSSEQRKRDLELMHYVLSIIFLERKLHKRQDMLEKIRFSIEDLTAKIEHYTLSHTEIIAQLAQIYTQTLSTFNYRIHVNGERRFLENPNNADKIRALLFAGIRSAVLWRQKGGHRLQFIFARGKILTAAQHFLQRLS
ncbi:MAG: high frequency lysogenization protein HflD [Pseudomonadota bacterium]|nr:high frequency lysogenization protein HflD [Pseudomonadota bacterium]